MYVESRKAPKILPFCTLVGLTESRLINLAVGLGTVLASFYVSVRSRLGVLTCGMLHP